MLLLFLFLATYRALAAQVPNFFRDATAEAFPEGILAVQQAATAWGDFNADGRVDLALTGKYSGSSSFQIYIQNTTGVFTRARVGDLTFSPPPPGIESGAVQWCNLFGDDSLPDLMFIGSSNGVSQTQVYRQTAPNQFVGILNATYFPGGIPDPLADGNVLCEDLNADGRPDLILNGVSALTGRNQNYVYIQTSSETFLDQSGSLTMFPDGLVSTYSGDVRLSASKEYLMICGDQNTKLSGPEFKLYRQTSPGVFADVTPSSFPGLSACYLQFTDFNMDGLVDISANGAYQPNQKSFYLFQNTGSGFQDITNATFSAVPAVSLGAFIWNTPDLNLILTGYSTQRIFETYQQVGFDLIPADPAGYFLGTTPVPVMSSTLDLVDTRANGLLDLFVTGFDGTTASVTKLYRRGCPEGEYLDLGLCVTCNGFVFPDARTCGVCPYLTFANASSGSCDSCPVPLTPSQDQQSCVACPEAEFYSVDRCTDCPLGQVHAADSLSCEPCPNDQFFNISSEGCVQCPSAEIQHQLFECRRCPNNTFFSSMTLECEGCSDNQVPASDQLSCQFCPSGLVANLEQNDCIPCPEGETFNSGTRRCSSPSSDSPSLVGPIIGSLAGVGALVVAVGCCLLIGCCSLTLCLVVVLAVIVILVIVILAGLSGGGFWLIRRRRRIQIDDLVFSQKLGEGAFGAVYSGECQGQLVAIKKLNVLLDAKAKADFEREAGILAKLNHPNVIGYIGTLVGEDICYLILELADGSLDHAYTRLDFGTKIRYAYQVALGLEYLHSQGVIHRDLSCRNVLLVHGVAKITDFGLSRLLETPELDGQQTQTTIGPVRWLPLEFLVQKRTSKAGDVYMFGMMLYELLTAAPPFAEIDNVHDVVAQIRAGQHPKMSPEWPAEIQSLLRECWSEVEDHRPSLTTVQEVLLPFASFDIDRTEGTEGTEDTEEPEIPAEVQYIGADQVEPES